MSRILPALAVPALLLGLSACATAPGRPSGQLSSYEGMGPKSGTLRASATERSNGMRLAGVSRVMIEPARMVTGRKTAWLSPQERTVLMREVDAQTCFELSERYALTWNSAEADARVKVLVTRVKPTGRTGSAASAAAGFFIPGPIGVRMAGAMGGLGGEAEMVDRRGRQLASLVWNRNATLVGTDKPSLSRVGDALQFAEPFADATAKAMTVEGAKALKIAEDDPCAQYGPRFRPEGWLAKVATGLYVPQMSGARAVPEVAADAADRAKD